MTENCEHPFCTRLVSTTCLYHCQLDLCHEHTIEHEHLFRVQYEKSFNNLKQSLQKLVQLNNDKKLKLNNDYEKNISLINENHKNKLNELERQFLFVGSTDKLIKKKLQLLADVRNGQAFLYQYDIEQIKLYLTNILEYHRENIVEQSAPLEVKLSPSFSSGSDTDIDYVGPANTSKSAYSNIDRYRGRCPLTHYGVYGLTSQHNVRLCSSNTDASEFALLKHFHRYHYLTWAFSTKLTKAVIDRLDPLTTIVFQSGMNHLDQFFQTITCPLNKVKSSKCKRKFLRSSLRQHLLKYHRMTTKECNRALHSIKLRGDLHDYNCDETEFN